MDILENLNNIVETIDMALGTKKKRRIVGGILLSISFLFGGLAITTMTVRTEEIVNDM